MKTENLTKAAQTADLLFQDLTAAHRGAKGALEMMLYDLMSDASKIRGRLNRLVSEEKE
jgi:hypothetical protein